MPKLLNELPEDLLLHIFLYLPPSDLSSIRCLSTFFHRVATDNWLWKNHVKKYFPHYFPPLANEKGVDYRKIFYNAMASDYQSTRQVDFEYIDEPFSKEEAAMFNAAKLDALDSFSKLLVAYDNPKKLGQLFSLADKTQRALFHWAGYFASQRILDCIFENISTFFTVESGMDHTIEISGFTYHQLAVMCNQMGIIKQLSDEELQTLNLGANPILAVAVSCCHIDLIRYLFEERGLDLSASINGRKPLHYAAAHGNAEILEYVLSKCEITKDDTVTLFAASIDCNNTISLQFLLKNDYDVNARESIPQQSGNVVFMSSSKDCALETALTRKRPVLAIMLLANPACSGHVALAEKIYHNRYTFSPEMNLALAQQLFQSASKYYLDEHGNYDTSKKDLFGNSIFHWLAFCNQVEILSSLSDRLGNEANSSRHTPVQLAAICGHLDIIKIYLSNGLDVNTPYDYSETLLYTATRHGHKELVSYLVTSLGININSRNDHDSTPLREACAKGFEEIAAILLMAGADVNLSNLLRVTPLIAAVEKGHSNILEMLLAHPLIDINLKAINGSTALDYARDNRDEECAELLQRHQRRSYCTLL